MSDQVREELDRRGYRVERELGKGGMGVVYVAEQVALKRRVALKLIQTDALAEPERRRFRKEAQSIQQVQHPNVVRLLDVELEEEPWYIALEYVPGATSLADLLERGAIPPGKEMDLILDIAAGLAAVHERFIVHRDVKPANILVDDQGRAKLIDFGLARSVSAEETRQTQDGQVVGTLSYMAPEQMTGQDAGTTADVYSFGLVACEILAGRLLFSTQSGGPDRMMPFERLTKGVPPAGHLVPAIKPKIGSVLTRCFEKDVHRRPTTCGDVLELLRKAREAQGDATGLVDSGRGKPGVKARGTPSVKTVVLAPAQEPRASLGRAGQLALVLLLWTVTVALGFLAGRNAATRAGSVPVSPPSPARPSLASRLNFEAGRLILHIDVTPAVGLVLRWIENGVIKTRAFEASSAHQVELSGIAWANVSDIQVQLTDGRLIDLVELMSPRAEILAGALDGVPVDKMIRRAATLLSRPTSTGEYSEVTGMMRDDLWRIVWSQAPMVSTYLRRTRNERARLRLLTSLYRVEVLDEFLKRNQILDLLHVGSCLPPTWRQREFRVTDLYSAKNDMLGDRQALKPITYSQDGAPRPGGCQLTKGINFTYLSLPTPLAVGPMDTFEAALRKNDGASTVPGSTTFEISLSDEMLRNSDVLRIGINGSLSGECLLRVNVNDRLDVPFYMHGGRVGEKQRWDPRDWFRFVPASVLQPGNNRLTFTVVPYPGLSRIQAANTFHAHLIIWREPEGSDR